MFDQEAEQRSDADGNTSTTHTVELPDFLSDEKLPDSWPDEFPGITKFGPSEPATSLQFDSGDINLVNNLGNLAPGALVDEIKAISVIACRLATEEEHERTRGRILRVLL